MFFLFLHYIILDYIYYITINKITFISHTLKNEQIRLSIPSTKALKSFKPYIIVTYATSTTAASAIKLHPSEFILINIKNRLATFSENNRPET